MARLGNVPEINNVKLQLDKLKQQGLIAEWELPYENILTRLNAAIFFLTPEDESLTHAIWSALSTYGDLKYEPNSQQLLSKMKWRVQFGDF